MSARPRPHRLADRPGFVRSVVLRTSGIEDEDDYPFSIPAVRYLVGNTLDLDPRVTFLIGENGSGKSTLIEAIAFAAGLNPEGGSKHFNFATRASHSPLGDHLRLVRNPRRERDSYFLRAESFYNVATEIERLGPGLFRSYGGESLHSRSHGESFIALLQHRLRGNGLYLFDEPEAALSPTRQLAALGLIDQLVRGGSQFIIATHSPIIMAYPGATILHLTTDGIAPAAYTDTEHYAVTRMFLNDREAMLAKILDPEAGDD